MRASYSTFEPPKIVHRAAISCIPYLQVENCVPPDAYLLELSFGTVLFVTAVE
jgi:hypothetical protein